MSVLSSKGFIRGTFDEYVVELTRTFKELFGSDIDTTERTPTGQLIRLMAYERIERDDLAEMVYNSRFIDTAEGVSLDKAVKNKGIIRFGASLSTGKVRLLVDEGLQVNSGVIVGVPNGPQYYITQTVQDTDNDGIINDVAIEAIEPGAVGNVEPLRITEIVTPVAGLNGVENLTETVGGRNQETDSELKNRYHTTQGNGSTTDGIRASILNDVPGVRAVTIIENETDSTDSEGRPRNSFEPIVLGGDPVQIAQAILNNKAGGIRSYGEETITLKDTSNRDKKIGFTYAQSKDVFVEISLKISNEFPIDGQDVIELETIRYIGGLDIEGNLYSGLNMGENVIHGRIASKIFQLPGVLDATVRLSTDGENYVSENIELTEKEVAQTSYEKVVINLV